MTPLASSLAVAVERGPLRWAAAPAAWALVLLLIAVALSIRTIYRREEGRIPAAMRGFLTLLRLAAVVLVLGALFRPYREEVQKTEDKGRLVILVDTSASMGTKDRHRPDDEKRLLAAAYPEDGPDRRPAELSMSRLDLVKRVLSPAGDALLSRLSERFVVQVFAFDEELRSIDPAEVPAEDAEGGDAAEAAKKRTAEVGRRIRALEANGPRTDLATAILGVARDALGRDDRRLAGVVLISDGKDNSESQRAVDAVMGLGKAREDLRVSAVALGDPRLAKNLKVDHVGAKEIVLKQEIVTFQTELKQTGFDDVDGVELRLEIEQTAEKDGKPLATPRPYKARGEDPHERLSARLKLLPSDRATSVALRALFSEAGTFRVRVKAQLPKALRGEDAVAEDDEKTVTVRVVDQTIRVLLVDGTLRYEAHFLKNLLVRETRHQGDPRQIDAQVWIQSFDNDVEQPHSRDMPPLRAFPSTKAEIYAYDVIIIGDVDWRALGGVRAGDDTARKILQTIKEFVADGGGVAFVAGENRNPDALATTPLGDILPVIARPGDREETPMKNVRKEGFRIAPTDAGLVHPILSVLQETPEAVARAWQRDGWVWYWLYRATGGLKPGAFALARVSGVSSPEYRDDRQELLPVFVGMPFGKGRVFFSAVDQIHRTRREYGDVYYGSFWDETIRWLATYRLLSGSKRYKIETDKKEYFVGESAVIRVTALDADYSPLKAERLEGLQVEDPDGQPMLRPGEGPVLDREAAPGTYRTEVRLPRSGDYRIYVEPPTRDGGDRAEERIQVKFATREAQDTVPDHDTLKAIVKATYPPGQAPDLVPLWGLPKLLDEYPPRSTERVLDRKEIQLWDTPTTLILATILLALEWILRKRYQLI